MDADLNTRPLSNRSLLDQLRYERVRLDGFQGAEQAEDVQPILQIWEKLLMKYEVMPWAGTDLAAFLRAAEKASPNESGLDTLVQGFLLCQPFLRFSAPGVIPPDGPDGCVLA